jgi:phosphoglycolate phosphatase
VVASLPGAERTETVISAGVRYFKDDYEKRQHQSTALFAGVSEMLDGLIEIGFRMAILSNKPDEYTADVCDRWLRVWKFERVVGARENIPLKPAPDGALHIASELRVAPDAFIYVGDTGTDMETAVAAGMYPVGALWGYRKAEELIAAGARELIQTPIDLISVAERRFAG